MKTNFFEFYKTHHNEDCPPYIYKNGDSGLLVVADGLGGSGGFAHELTDEQLAHAREALKNYMLPELFGEWKENKAEEKKSAENAQKTTDTVPEEGEQPESAAESAEEEKEASKPAVSEEFLNWLDTLLEPILEGSPCTSALWGSRILTSRFAYYMLTHADCDISSPDVRSEIVDYIYKGLNLVKSKFNLSTAGNPNYSLLPSTFVALQYEIDKEDVTAKIIWAGDSRAYALLPADGIKQLTVDDEDNSGAITNLFRLKENKTTSTELRYSKYRVPAKSILFVCSDGFFDPYDGGLENIGVEELLLKNMAVSDSFESFRENWYQSFVPTKHDDCSIAFGAFGFKSFSEMQELCSARAKALTSLSERYTENKDTLALASNTENNPEEYLYNRANQRITQIAELILNEATGNPNTTDPAVTDDVKAFISGLTTSAKDAANAEKAAKEKAVAQTILASVRHNPEEAAKIFVNCEGAAPEIKAVFAALAEKKTVDASLNSQLQAIIQCEENVKKAFSECEDAIKKIGDCIEDYKAQYTAATNLKFEIERVFENFKKTVSYSALSQDEIDKLGSDITRAPADLIKTKEREIKALTEIENFWEEKIKDPENKNKAPKNRTENNRIRIFLDAERKWRQAKGNLKSCKNTAEEKKASPAVQVAVQKCHAALSAITEAIVLNAIFGCNSLMTPEACQKYGIPVITEVKAISKEDLLAELIKLLKDESNGIYKKLIDEFAVSTEPSVIISYFIPKKLETLRKYRAADMQMLQALLEEMKELFTLQEDFSKIKI